MLPLKRATVWQNSVSNRSDSWARLTRRPVVSGLTSRALDERQPAEGAAAGLSLCDSAPDESSDSNDRCDDEQPPDEPNDADKHEHSNDDTKKYFD